MFIRSIQLAERGADLTVSVRSCFSSTISYAVMKFEHLGIVCIYCRQNAWGTGIM